MNTGKLILAPLDPRGPSAPAELVLEALAKIGLTGEALDADHADYLAGPRFLELISFLGCSAHVELEPPVEGGRAFCRIRLVGPFASPRLFVGRNTAAPRCPRCGGRLDNWRARIQAPQLSCEQCGEDLQPGQLSWRRSGGCARIAVEVHNVFPSEAVPLPELLKRLAQATAQDWGYFYVQPED